jgi:hypothetical protein
MGISEIMLTLGEMSIADSTAGSAKPNEFARRLAEEIEVAKAG